MHAKEIIAAYKAEEAEFKHRALLISVNRTASERGPYDAVRYAWKLSKKRAMQAELVLAIEKGVIKGVFVPEKWLAATSENFPGRSGEPGRIGFVGREAAPEISKLYLGKRIPDEYKFGTAMPIRYTWS
jgi:hypothetical protein